MHEPALELPRVGWSSRLRLARRAASARVDVLLFAAVAAIVALHAAVDSFIGGGLSARPNEYERRVVGFRFFERTLVPGVEDTS